MAIRACISVEPTRHGRTRNIEDNGDLRATTALPPQGQHRFDDTSVRADRNPVRDGLRDRDTLLDAPHEQRSTCGGASGILLDAHLGRLGKRRLRHHRLHRRGSDGRLLAMNNVLSITTSPTSVTRC
jgi:hypothetical protein